MDEVDQIPRSLGMTANLKNNHSEHRQELLQYGSSIMFDINL